MVVAGYTMSIIARGDVYEWVRKVTVCEK